MKIRKSDIVNIVFPLVLGAVLYIILSPDVIFVQVCFSYLPFKAVRPGNIFWKFVRNYFLDMLWTYSLIHALWIVARHQRLKNIYIIGLLFSVLIECMQVFPSVKGIFDPYDIVAEVVAGMIAFLHLKRRTQL